MKKDVIKLNSVELIYQSAESFSVKKFVRMIFNKELKKSFLLQYKALNDISFNIKKGNVYGIIGNNGAGKSTLLRLLSGAMSPTSGTIERNYSTINLLALGVGFTRDMTGYENIYLNGMLLGFTKKYINKKINDIIEYSELGDFIYKPMKTYSSGMVSRLGFSIAINLKPEVLLVDEILSVGDVKFREKSFNSIRSFIEDDNTTVVIVSHSIQQIKDLCNYVVWIEKGNMIAKGDTHNILDVYTKVNKELISISQAKEELKDTIKVDGNKIYFDISNYKLCFDNAFEKRFFGRIYDYSKTFELGKTNLTLTVRRLNNDDLVIYCVNEGSEDVKITFNIDDVKDRLCFDKMYKKPEYSKTFGEIKATGPNGFFDLNIGSMMVSKITHFNNLEQEYKDGKKSILKEFVSESNNIKLLDKNTLEFNISAKSLNSSFFLILSKAKLFRSFSNMKSYMEYYYSSIENNVNMNPFFQLPDATYTKVPYSVEPFSRDAYGYNLTNIFNTDLMERFISSNERFYNDIIVNTILQTYMYKKNKEEVFFTDYTSTWIKKEADIVAPYFDVNLNISVADFLRQFKQYSPFGNKLNPVKGICDYICEYLSSNGEVYKLGDGVMFPSYFGTSNLSISNTTLSHQLGIARILLEGYMIYKDENYISVAEKIFEFLKNSKEMWINKENGDLFHYLRYGENKTLEFYGNDYIYNTLYELLCLQSVYKRVNCDSINTDIEFLIDKKIGYLNTTEYGIYNENAPAALGEKIDIKNKIVKLYSEISDMESAKQ